MDPYEKFLEWTRQKKKEVSPPCLFDPERHLFRPKRVARLWLSDDYEGETVPRGTPVRVMFVCTRCGASLEIWFMEDPDADQ